MKKFFCGVLLGVLFCGCEILDVQLLINGSEISDLYMMDVARSKDMIDLYHSGQEATFDISDAREMIYWREDE